MSGSEDNGPKGQELPEEGADPMDELIVAMLAEGHTHANVAQQCAISTKTVQRRLKDPVFAALVAERRRERISAVTGRLVTLTDGAVDVLHSILASDDERLRFQAARTVLELGRRYHREDGIEWDLALRLDEVERVLSDPASPDLAQDAT